MGLEPAPLRDAHHRAESRPGTLTSGPVFSNKHRSAPPGPVFVTPQFCMFGTFVSPAESVPGSSYIKPSPGRKQPPGSSYMVGNNRRLAAT
ncbi:hypothetical protein RRG08_045545, partial [Elysia crispata]